MEYYSAVKNEAKNIHEIKVHRNLFTETRRTLRNVWLPLGRGNRLYFLSEMGEGEGGVKGKVEENVREWDG